MKKILFVSILALNGFSLFSQNLLQTASFNADCSTDFWTITADGYIQQWSLSGGSISRGDTILSGGGVSLSYCGNINSPTFYTDNWGPGAIGIDYYDAVSGWINIPTANHVQDNGGHHQDQYYTVVGAITQWVNYWDGSNLTVIDSLPGEFFAGIFDIAVDTFGHAWISISSSVGTSIDSLKVYDQGGKINSYSFQYDMQGYGSFFLNDTLYLGTSRDSIYPVHIIGNSAQLGNGIPFPSSNFTDMASCQNLGPLTSVDEHPISKPKIFPNPTYGQLNLSIENEKSDVSVYNSTGQLLELRLEGNTLDLRDQPAGVFYIKISTDRGTSFHKILKH